jgi:hypothetical protein
MPVGEFHLRFAGDFSFLTTTLGQGCLERLFLPSRPDLPTRLVSLSSLAISWRPAAKISSSFAYGVCHLVATRDRSTVPAPLAIPDVAQ